MSIRILTGDCRIILPTLPDASVDSIVTDPPYGLSFMGKAWDYDVPGVDIWRECLRVLKPGGHLLAFAGTRTQHRMCVNIEDAGFEIRDMIAWVYGSGFPKSLDVSKAIDRAAGVEREVVGSYKATGTARTLTGGNYGGGGANVQERDRIYQTAPTTDAARQWQGWGSALKPAMEPITVARKPIRGTVAANVLAHGTGGLNIDGCRIGGNVEEMRGRSGTAEIPGGDTVAYRAFNADGGVWEPNNAGRWPANLIHDGSDEVVALFPETTIGAGNKNTGNRDNGKTLGHGLGKGIGCGIGGDTGSAARFFYTAKASASERNAGLAGMTPIFSPTMGNGIGGKEHDPATATPKYNHHPTVKPTDLMRYLCRLVTPPGGTVLDPFAGSGSTLLAADQEGFDGIGIELSPEYAEIARRRIIGDCPLFADVA